MGTAHDIVDGTKITRDKVEIGDDEYRMYKPEDGDPQWVSVSEVLDARPTPEKDAGIQSWKEWLRSQDDRPDPEDVKRFKTSRGTLAHYKALKPLAARDLREDDVLDAYESLKGWEYRHDDALSQATDGEWFVDTFAEIAEQQGIAEFERDENGDLVREDGDPVVVDHGVRTIEQYVVEEEVGYAGQFDLAYDRRDGTSVMADLKASKADNVDDLMNKKFPRYPMQLSAYARAATFDPDELQVIWISPDTNESAVISEREWPRSRQSYEADFLRLTDTIQTELDEYYE